MARPSKIGLDYFPFDVDFFEDERIEAISGEFGLKGELVTVKLLCAVYSNGYFAVWNNLIKMKLLKRLPGVSADLLDQIVNRLVLWGFFEKSLFDSDGVLTSTEIQARYFAAIKRRTSTDDLVYVINNGVNVYRNPSSSVVNVCKNPQRKEKENKVKEIKEEESKESPSIEDLVLEFQERERQKLSEDLKKDPPELRPPPLSADDYESELKNNRLLIETMCMTRGFSEGDVLMSMRDFFAEKKVEGHKWKDVQDAVRHFMNWSAFWKEKKDKAPQVVSKGKIQQGVEVSASAADRIRQQRANQ